MNFCELLRRAGRMKNHGKIHNCIYLDWFGLGLLLVWHKIQCQQACQPRQGRRLHGRFFSCTFMRVDCWCLLQMSSNESFVITRIIQSFIYYAPAGRYINAWMHSLKKSVKPEIVNRYDLWVLRHKIGGAKVFVNNVQWSDQTM